MKRHRAAVLLGALLSACSDAAGPSPGTFRAQLTGVRTASLSGAALGEVTFVGEFPELQFVIRMVAERGDTVHVLVIRCRGDQPPAAGTYTVDASGADCVGNYFGGLSTPEGEAIMLEGAAASAGRLTVVSSPVGQTAGNFVFSGTLVAGTDSVGTLQASGVFSAEVF